MPEADAVAEAGRLVQRLPELWAAADLTERRRLLLTVLDAVYVDARETRAVVGIRPKAAFELFLPKIDQSRQPTTAIKSDVSTFSLPPITILEIP